ncbi:hypothetical protein B0H14DRAFT_3719304 [Mycena olivaceomarginata]|nr:hypothetical protein B0H14DRAFT_3719304 [Mycena olivaceomarginata]
MARRPQTVVGVESTECIRHPLDPLCKSDDLFGSGCACSHTTIDDIVLGHFISSLDAVFVAARCLSKGRHPPPASTAPSNGARRDHAAEYFDRRRPAGVETRPRRQHRLDRRCDRTRRYPRSINSVIDIYEKRGAGNAVNALIMDSFVPKAKVKHAGSWSWSEESAELVPGDMVGLVLFLASFLVCISPFQQSPVFPACTRTTSSPSVSPSLRSIPSFFLPPSSSTHFLNGLNLAIPACSLCMNRRLYQIASVRTVTKTRAEEHRAIMIALQALAAQDYPHAVSFVNEALAQDISSEAHRAEDFQESIRPAPAFTQSLVKVASVHMEQGDLTKAFECFDEAIRQNPDDPDIYHRGQVLLTTNEFADAAENYTKSTELDDGFVFSHIQLAVAQYKGGNLANSLATFRRTLKAFPTRSEPQNCYGELLLDQQRFADAVEKLDRAVELEKLKSPPNDVGAAERCCNEALRLDPECEVAVATLAQLRSLAGQKIERAVEMFARPHIALGISIGLLASFIQSLGLTIQRKSHVLNESLPENEQRVEHCRPSVSTRSRSLVQIASLPVAILAPLGAVSLLWNAFFAPPLLGDAFSPWMVLGTLLIAGGAILIVIFGIVPEPTRSLEDLLEHFSRPAFVVYFSLLGTAVLVSLIIVRAVSECIVGL